jgi:hypothetical protein
MSKAAPTAVVAVDLPNGGKLVASSTPQRQSAECSAATNLQAQIAPWIASMSCQFLILRLLKPLIDIVRALPPSPGLAGPVEDFLEIVEELAPCMAMPTAAAVLPFVRDLLCLVIQNLTCLRHNLEVITKLVAADPGAVIASEVQSVLDSYQPIVGLLDLAGSIFGIAGMATPQAPQLEEGTDSASLSADQTTILNFISELQTVADALGGCQ